MRVAKKYGEIRSPEENYAQARRIPQRSKSIKEKLQLSLHALVPTHCNRVLQIAWDMAIAAKDSNGNLCSQYWEEMKDEEMERPMRIELTPEPWQGSVLPLY